MPRRFELSQGKGQMSYETVLRVCAARQVALLISMVHLGENGSGKIACAEFGGCAAEAEDSIRCRRVCAKGMQAYKETGESRI